MKCFRIISIIGTLIVCCALFSCTEEEEKLGTIYGTVTDYATGEPVGNANVKLRPNGETTLTGSDGTFEFVDLAAGNYSLLITKAQYADLDDDYIIELEAGKEVKRDVQLRKRVASLKIVDMSGNSLDTLDFGDQESVKVKTFNVFNDGTETLTCTVTYDCEWIANVSGLENQIPSGQTVPVTVRIDRVALADGDNTTFLYITSANGSNELVVKASFLGQPVIKTKDPTEVTSNSATVGGKITDDGGRPVLARGICYGTSQSPDISGAHTEDGSGTGEFGHNVTGLSAATTYYARAYATNRNGTYYASNIVSFTTTSGLPTVTTDNVTNITTTTAKCGGNVTNNGGYNVTARGICWNTKGGPDLNDQHTTNGSGNGAFTANLTGLEPYKTYYVRAYATNQIGTSYGEEKSFTTNDGSITVTTKSVSNITPTSAMGGGEVTVSSGNTFPVTARGVCWGTNHNPSIADSHSSDGSGAGTFTSSITGLTVNTTYYVRAYATNQQGTFYGEEKSFTTNDGSITVTTKSVSDITPTSAMCGGEVTVPSGNTFPVTARGVCWGTNHNPSTADSHSSDGSGAGSFTSSITGLAVNTTYYVRAYATNEIGTFYGSEKTFSTTIGMPVVNTADVSDITANSAKSGGDVGDNGGFAVTARGVCWNTMGNPDLSDNHTANGIGNGTFISNLTGLASNTTYHVRAYATNQIGTSYGEEITFTTVDGSVTVSTNEVTGITPTTAMCGGNVTVAQGNNLPVTARGVCWSTSHNPTTADYHTSDGTGAGAFTSLITDLTVNTVYYVRAYAVNEVGIFYGGEKSFTTMDGLPVVTTKNITGIAPLSANSGGVVTSDNGFTVTARGVCWSTVSNPTISDAHTTNGSGMGEFNSAISGLQNSTTYHVRAYATNSKGTAYGDDKTFTTTSGEITVTTNNVTNIGPLSATCGGNVSVGNDNNLPITAKGVCWSTNHNPSLNDDHTNDGTGQGAFISSITGLSTSSNYYVRAYAINQLGTYYGTEQAFSTTDGLPSVNLDINSFSIVSSTSVSCISNVVSDGGLSVTARGVCWSTIPLPTIIDSHTNDGSGLGFYTSVLNNINSSTVYYIRSYATNSAGTAYSDQFVLTPDYYEYINLPRMQYDGCTYVIYPDLGARMSYNNASSACQNLSYAGYDDWYLPNRYELQAMYINRDVIGGFNTQSGIESVYWSSTYEGSHGGYSHYFAVEFSNGVVDYWASNNLFRVRPVRKIVNRQK